MRRTAAQDSTLTRTGPWTSSMSAWLLHLLSREVRRARIGPGLRPGPCRQARWVGRGSRVNGGPEGAFRGAWMGSTVEAGGADPDNARRSGPVAVTFAGDRRTRRERDGLALLAGAASGRYGGDRWRPVAGVAVRGSRRAVGLPSEGRGEAADPQRRDPRRTSAAIAGHPDRSPSPGYSRPTSRSRSWPSGLARRRCALEAVEKAHYIRWVVALRENPGRCGSGRAEAAAALRRGFVLG